MKEQSQIEEMRAALRGDRERADQARQRTVENVLQFPEDAVDAPPPDAQAVEPRQGFLGRLLGR